MTLVVSDTLPPNRNPHEAGVVPIVLALGEAGRASNPAPRAAVARTERGDLLASTFLYPDRYSRRAGHGPNCTIDNGFAVNSAQAARRLFAPAVPFRPQ